MKVQSIGHINNSLQQYFRASKRIRIHNRKGIYLIVDDRKEAVEMIRRLFDSKNISYEIASAKNVSEAKNKIKEQQNGEYIKAVVIDLSLEGEGSNGNGMSLIEWLENNYEDIPYIISTGRENKEKEIKKQFPGVDIFIKGKNSIDDLADALGINEKDEKDDTKIIPKDLDQEEESNNSSFSKMLNKFFNIFCF